MTHQPLTHRAFRWLADTLSVPAVITGIVCSLLFGGFALWFAWAIGAVAQVMAGDAPSIHVRAPVTLFMMVGYLPMAIYYMSVWTNNHLETIDRQFDLRMPSLAFPRRTANLLGTAGVVAVYFLFLHKADQPLLLFQPLKWTAAWFVPLVGLVFMGWFNFRFMFLLIWYALAVSRTANRIRTIDLLDTTLVKPYAQHGVRSSLLAVVSLSISSNLWLDPKSPAIGSITTIVMLVAATALALFLPTWGIHQRLKALKEFELKQIREAIASRRDPHKRSLHDAHQLQADLALEQRLSQISEWPFDGASYGRVALYVLVGLGSWIGAALVERLLGSIGA